MTKKCSNASKDSASLKSQPLLHKKPVGIILILAASGNQWSDFSKELILSLPMVVLLKEKKKTKWLENGSASHAALKEFVLNKKLLAIWLFKPNRISTNWITWSLPLTAFLKSYACKDQGNYGCHWAYFQYWKKKGRNSEWTEERRAEIQYFLPKRSVMAKKSHSFLQNLKDDVCR